MPVTIDQLNLSDAPLVFDFVLRLLAELGAESGDLGELRTQQVLDHWQRDADRIFTFAARENDGRIVGLLTLVESFAIYANGNHGIINEMYVASDQRSRGVGRLLLDAAKEVAGRRGWSRIDVTAPESPRWQRTRRFYESNGFTFAGPKLKFSL